MSEALRLADALEQAPVHTQEDGTVLLYLGGTVVADKAAAELRRLHAVNEELLEALEEYVNADPIDDALNPRKRKARAAIAKAGGEA